MSSEGVEGFVHPAYAAHFTDPFYDDPADDFAPFGSDEGSDLLVEAEEQRSRLGPSSTVADVLELTAAEDRAGRWLQEALDRTLRSYGDDYADQHALMTRDLASFG